MIKRFFYPSLLLFSFMFAGCSPEKSDPDPYPEPPTPVAPVISVDPVQFQVPAEGGDFSFAYSIDNPSDTAELSVSCAEDWVFLSDNGGTVGFSVSPWESMEGVRTAEILLSYTGAEDVTVSVVQSPAELPACPVEMYIVHESYYYARITWLPENDDLAYISFIMDKETFDSYESEDALFADDVAFYQERADALGVSLEEYITAFDVLYQGGMTEDVTGRTPGTEYVVYTYAAVLQDGALVRTSAIGTQEFRTKELVIKEADFTIEAEELRSNRMTLNVSTDDTDFRFAMTLFSESDFSQFPDEQSAAEEMIRLLEIAIYNNGLSWEDVTYSGEGRAHYDDLIAGGKYYAVACGVDDAVIISNVAIREFVVPMPEITDACTFSAEFTNVTQTEMDVTVVPSDGSTRYLAVIEESSAFTSVNTPEVYVARLLYNLVYFDAVDWSNTPLLHSGTHTFNSNTDVVNPEYLKADTDYTLLVFGVDEYGERTTQIAEFEQRTPSAQQEDLEIGIEITSVEEKAINAVFTPSADNVNYHFDAYPLEDYEGETPESFMEYVIAINGEYLKLYQGRQEYSFTYYFPRPEYVVFAFGYNGEITSDLYMKRVNMSTGEVTDVGIVPRETAQKYFESRR